MDVHRRTVRLKPRPHQQQCRSNIVERYKLNDSFDSVECCFDIVAVFGNNVAGCFDIVAGVDGALQIAIHSHQLMVGRIYAKN